MEGPRSSSLLQGDREKRDSLPRYRENGQRGKECKCCSYRRTRGGQLGCRTKQSLVLHSGERIYGNRTTLAQAQLPEYSRLPRYRHGRSGLAGKALRSIICPSLRSSGRRVLCGCSSVGRASRCQRDCRGFESLQPLSPAATNLML